MAVCRALNVRYPFSHTTALALLKVEQPTTNTLNGSMLHATVSKRNKLHRRVGLQLHLLSTLTSEHIITIDRNLHVLRPEMVWHQLAGYTSIDEQVALAESMIRHNICDMKDLQRTVAGEKFPHRKQCIRALSLASPGSDSPKETQLRLVLLRYGMPAMVVNYTFTNLHYYSGKPISLDLAIPEWKIGIEYNGDHHRTDQQQWRRDNWKWNMLRSKHWEIVTVDQLDLSDEWHQQVLACKVAQAIMKQTGKVVPIQPRLSLEQLTDKRRKLTLIRTS
ncbi:hypothetical protein G1C95_0013 [Bifidobacterium sp. DSM 109957]|uniref:DUF559 domain-containing protein n=2 Tax=Bifidobacterium oedipodis TaxID=2675322 RepID=A0A7Y0EMB0_9BIFI|nr:hypothetical protein [Bifidobacterium sp. DSM 109957]